MRNKKLIAIAIASALSASPAWSITIDNAASEIVALSADPMLALESNRSGIVERLVSEYRGALAASGIAEVAFRNALSSLRIDQLLAASLVNSLQEVSTIVAASPSDAGTVSRYVAVAPTNTLAALPAAEAYLVRNGERLSVVKPAQLQLTADTQLVGYFAAPPRVAVSTGITLKDGPGSGANSWIGYTAGSNNASGNGSAVAAGTFNSATGQNAFIGAGIGQLATGSGSAVTAGSFNAATGQGAFVGAGTSNVASGTSSLVIGGFDNQATAIDALVGAGAGHRATGARSVVVGGGYNRASGQWAFVGGGGRQTANAATAGNYAEDNVASGDFSMVAGGQGNRAVAPFSVVGGGLFNVAEAKGNYNFVGGGVHNTATGSLFPGSSSVFVGTTVVVGGGCNVASGIASVVVGGGVPNPSPIGPCIDPGNTAAGNFSFIGGGIQNQTGNEGAIVVGGGLNIASGSYSTVPGGFHNVASGAGSFAAGTYAFTETAGPTVVHDGAFVWADNQAFNPFRSTAPNEFSVRATGGVRFVTANAGSATVQSVNITPAGELTFPEVGRQQIRMSTASTLQSGMGAQDQTTYLRTPFHFAFFRGGAHSDTALDAGGGGAVLATLSSAPLATAVAGTLRVQAVVSTSDRNAKTDFATLDARTVLAKVAELPVSTWSYKSEARDAIRHIGPTAQDFSKLFGVGYDDKSIATVDADGVALAAIKGLVEEARERDSLIDTLRSQLRAQQQRIAALEQRMTASAATTDDPTIVTLIESLRREVAALRSARQSGVVAP